MYARVITVLGSPEKLDAGAQSFVDNVMPALTRSEDALREVRGATVSEMGGDPPLVERYEVAAFEVP